MATRIVIAMGGNALGNTPEEQRAHIEAACPSLVDLIELGNEIVVCHGNGPQVGIIQLAFDEASARNEKVCSMDLPECTAMSQGYIGYHLQNGLLREIRKRNMPWDVATIVTQVVVEHDDPAFRKPTKPIGAFYPREKMEREKMEDPTLHFIEDAGRGYRKVVPSPRPVDVVEASSISSLLDNEFVVIACGGGGVPVIRRAEGDLQGVPAVIDKDFSAAKLAELLDCKYLFILTAVDHVCINYGKPDQMNLTRITTEEAEEYIAQGQFAAGSMLPKVEAAVSFVRSGPGRQAIIGALENAPQALRGECGTLITA